MKQVIKDYQLLIGSLVVASAILYSNDSTTHQLQNILFALDSLGNDVNNVVRAVELINERLR